MSNTKTVLLRFNLDKPPEREAFEFLRNADKANFKSYSKTIIAAVTDYFKRYYRDIEDPYFETREREERFIQQIIETVEKALEKSLPNFLTVCLAGIVQPYAVAAVSGEKQEKEVDIEDIDWGLLSE